MENLPDCGLTAEQRAGSFSTVPNYDQDEEAWSVDDIGELQVEVSTGGAGDGTPDWLRWDGLSVCWDVPQLPEVHTSSCDNISQFSVDSISSLDSKEPVFIAAGDIRWDGDGGRRGSSRTRCSVCVCVRAPPQTAPLGAAGPGPHHLQAGP